MNVSMHKHQSPISLIRKALRILGKVFATIILIALLAVFATSVSPVYRFGEPRPFSGPDIFNPYSGIDSSVCWKRANFHTHTRVKGILNECRYWPGETDAAYRKLGYDIVTFSNHNELTQHPYDPTLQVNVYEHGYNIFKYHKLVFGTARVDYFDHLLPLFAFQKQYQMDRLAGHADFIQLNHPLRTIGFSRSQMQKLEGFRIMELDSGKSTENEYWDWSLSAGHYSFGLANDDLHFPDRSGRIAVRSNFLCTPSATYDDLKRVLLGGGYYAMRTPDYGKGDWEVKYKANRNLPRVEAIGLMPGGTVYMRVSAKADSIKVTGQEHRTLTMARDTIAVSYTMAENDPYARITAYFPGGEVIYTNPFARYDASVSGSPFRAPSHTVDIPLTILFNLMVLLLCCGDMFLMYKIFK